MHATDASSLSSAQRGALALIRAYKLLFSVQFAGSCRFMPSCSEYAAEAVRRFGVARGSLLALRRLSRCHPLGSSGYDPVPGTPSPFAPSRQAPPQI
jgi:putative membrane protein insertion efficiency factor